MEDRTGVGAVGREVARRWGVQWCGHPWESSTAVSICAVGRRGGEGEGE